MKVVCEADRERWLASIPALLPADNSAQVAQARKAERRERLTRQREALLAQVAAIEEEVNADADSPQLPKEFAELEAIERGGENNGAGSDTNSRETQARQTSESRSATSRTNARSNGPAAPRSAASHPGNPSDCQGKRNDTAGARSSDGGWAASGSSNEIHR